MINNIYIYIYIFFFFLIEVNLTQLKKKNNNNNLTQFYSTELNYLSLKRNIKKIVIKILQKYSTLLQKLIINFNFFTVITLFYFINFLI